VAAVLGEVNGAGVVLKYFCNCHLILSICHGITIVSHKGKRDVF